MKAIRDLAGKGVMMYIGFVRKNPFLKGLGI
jgi:hypothetical protein